MLGPGDDAWASADHIHALLVGFVQFLQYYYQSGCLYRLRALGERHNMDLTVGKLGSSLTGCPSPTGPAIAAGPVAASSLPPSTRQVLS